MTMSDKVFLDIVNIGSIFIPFLFGSPMLL